MPIQVEISCAIVDLICFIFHTSPTFTILILNGQSAISFRLF